ncbi:hypothetical protein [Oscillatoria sp. HE19RPO]|uniref:hypothetical protein n=1 Tax=Oscillatoria sp. HE19RPO TaxID=2954806 RepID=UPI0020C228DF|nr:hypothetical protein [Oscillatoria sp. HE19RPO]
MTNNTPNSIVDDSTLQKHSQAEPLSNTNSKGGEGPVGNSRVEQAIKDGQENFDKEDSESRDSTIELCFSKETHEQLKQVAHALNLNFINVINSAIHYIYFLSQKDKKFLNEIMADSPPRNKEEEGQDVHKKQFTLFVETNLKLKQMGLRDRVTDCASAGIRLLYENNCLPKPNQQTSSTSSSPSL